MFWKRQETPSARSISFFNEVEEGVRANAPTKILPDHVYDDSQIPLLLGMDGVHRPATGPAILDRSPVH